MIGGIHGKIRRGTGRSPRCPGRPLPKARAGPLCYLASLDGSLASAQDFQRQA